MRYSFIVIENNSSELDNKLALLSEVEESEIIYIGSNQKDVKEYKNIKFINNKNEGKAIKDAIKIAKGKYINISYISDYISINTINRIERYFRKYPIVLLQKREMASKYNNYSKLNYSSSIYEKKFVINDYISSYFFASDILKNINIDETLDKNAKYKLIMDALHVSTYIYCARNYSVFQESIMYKNYFEEASSKEYLFETFRNFLLPLLKNNDNMIVKKMSLKIIVNLFMQNINAKALIALTDEERVELDKLVNECLSFIDLEYIYSMEELKLSRLQTKVLVYLKYNKELDKSKLNTNGDLVINDIVIDKPLYYKVQINAVNKENNKLIFDADYNAELLLKKGAKIIVEFNNQEVAIKENNIYSYTKFFEQKYNKKYTFSFEITLNKMKDDNTIKIYYVYKNTKINLDIEFNQDAPQARLSSWFTNSYWRYDKNHIMTHHQNDIYINKVTKPQLLKKELKLYKDFLFQSKKKSLGIRALFLRMVYRVTRPFYRGKRIWVTFDKLYKGGDNGEYFYQYCLKNQKKVRCYYIINKNAYDYKRLKHQKYVVRFKSIKEYLAVLNAECIFGTHAKVYNFCAFTKGKEKYFRDLFNTDIFCIQHGLTIQDIPHIQNRLYDNTKMYFCASEFEINNILKEDYDYTEKNISRSGLARFDGLKNKDVKQILITPTWRASMANSKTNIGGTRPYFDGFKKTPYFKIYNSIVNDKTLIETAKKTGYRIAFLIHPTLTAQIVDYDKNDYIDIFSVTEDQSYEKLLTESSLMVTDYSGVQYDFAYQRKPLIYYHPEELPPHYGAGGLDYEKDGFGPIITKKSDLIKYLCDMMKNECKNDEEYIKRANKFFIYDDFNNAKRIYEDALKYEDNKKKKRK